MCLTDTQPCVCVNPELMEVMFKFLTEPENNFFKFLLLGNAQIFVGFSCHSGQSVLVFGFYSRGCIQ